MDMTVRRSTLPGSFGSCLSQRQKPGATSVVVIPLPKSCIIGALGQANRHTLSLTAIERRSSVSKSCRRLCALFPGCEQLKIVNLGLQRTKRQMLVVVAASTAAGDGEAESKSVNVAGDNELVKTVQLGSLFGLWYLFNIYFNIYNKQVGDQSLTRTFSSFRHT